MCSSAVAWRGVDPTEGGQGVCESDLSSNHLAARRATPRRAAGHPHPLARQNLNLLSSKFRMNDTGKKKTCLAPSTTYIISEPKFQPSRRDIDNHVSKCKRCVWYCSGPVGVDQGASAGFDGQGYAGQGSAIAWQCCGAEATPSPTRAADRQAPGSAAPADDRSLFSAIT